MSLPTLATLIEACGEYFGALGRETACWLACEYVSERGEWENAHEGETPEDAVAGLGSHYSQRVEEESTERRRDVVVLLHFFRVRGAAGTAMIE